MENPSAPPEKLRWERCARPPRPQCLGRRGALSHAARQPPVAWDSGRGQSDGEVLQGASQAAGFQCLLLCFPGRSEASSGYWNRHGPEALSLRGCAGDLENPEAWFPRRRAQLLPPCAASCLVRLCLASQCPQTAQEPGVATMLSPYRCVVRSSPK